MIEPPGNVARTRSTAENALANSAVTEDCPDRASDDRVRDELDPNTEILSLGSGGDLTIDGVRFRWPPQAAESECPGEENDNSVIVRMDFGEFSMLFTGDAEFHERSWLVSNHAPLIDVDVLKASHHGSWNGVLDGEEANGEYDGTIPQWLQSVSPTHVVISAGVNDRYGHPHAAAVEAYLDVAPGKVYCSNRLGTIRVYGFSDGRVWVHKQRHSAKSCVYDGTHY